MNREQLQNLVVEPTLKEIPKGYSEKAALAIMMIIAHESQRCEYISQLNSGPARGITQIEGWVHDDIWKNGDSIWFNAREMGIISSEEYHAKIHPHADRLIYDMRYAVFMTRQRLFMDARPLPDNITELSAYLKDFWNSNLGAANNESYADDYLLWG